jgi:hypothetical protein
MHSALLELIDLLVDVALSTNINTTKNNETEIQCQELEPTPGTQTKGNDRRQSTTNCGSAVSSPRDSA